MWRLPQGGKMAFRLSPEFADGSSYTVVKTKEELLECVANWADEVVDYPNESATIEFVEMTDAEINALPEI
jgi:hypothetical protein